MTVMKLFNLRASPGSDVIPDDLKISRGSNLFTHYRDVHLQEFGSSERVIYMYEIRNTLHKHVYLATNP